MSRAREALPPGPGRPARAAPPEKSFLISLPREKSGDRMAVGEKEITELSNNQSIQANTQDQSVWGNNGDDLVRTQPERSPLPNASVLEKYKEETGRTQNGHAGLSNGSGIHNGIKPVAKDNRTFSAPVSQKMHRKIQSSLSVGNESSKKSSAYSHKPGSSPEDCCVHCILACLFCEFVTLCSLVLGQASCGVCPSEVCCCCCCGEEMGDDCNCPCDMDCGIMDACCESSDCLEICMECCGICFPS
ncbi:myoD family inhibitor domain-containing protein isoform X3 [Sphaerodactylus townsendi]|uniref:myoD family inhibitor domain-containing protein isoform X3 n=1 Tax=Sphaerodactylus townsendi TaxID=933632 RepID=UPI0020265A37|nr:myoD family inhibitor domain-containing protein isoform X3 [Sphaerodactylus townsendi]